MITVTGRTYEHRDTLKSMGGVFNMTTKIWSFSRLNASELARVRGMVGVMVQVVDDPAPQLDDDDLNAIIAGLFGAKPERRPGIGSSAIYGDDATYHNHFADQNPSAFFGFSSLGKFTDYIEHIRPSQSRDPARSGWDDDDGDWIGTARMSDAIDLARNGWPEGVERAQDAMEALSVDNPRVRQRRAAVAGGTVNVGRMLSGDPAHMIRRPKSPGRKVVTFFVEAGCNGHIRSHSIINRAALIGAMVDLMENAGYSCAIVATDTSTSMGRPIYQLAVKLKEAGERLNLSDLMFALGHPSFLRRFSFAAASSQPETRSIWLSQGSSSNSFDDDHRCGPSEFYVPVLSANQSGDDPLFLLPNVIPDGLPVKIERE